MSPLIVANWKMQLGDADALETARRFAETLPVDVEVVLCPSFTALASVAGALRGSRIDLGAQDCAGAERGSLTGEVSPEDLVALGCRYVILGHSERRQGLGETDALVSQKVRAALRAGLCPIFCVGETSDERRRGAWTATLLRQLHGVLPGIELIGTQRLIIAYEPVWAIGTGQAATPEDAAEAHVYIKDTVQEIFGTAGSDSRVRLIYGGSVEPANISAFLSIPTVSGVLVGAMGQTAARLRNIIHAATSRQV